MNRLYTIIAKFATITAMVLTICMLMSDTTYAACFRLPGANGSYGLLCISRDSYYANPGAFRQRAQDIDMSKSEYVGDDSGSSDSGSSDSGSSDSGSSDSGSSDSGSSSQPSTPAPSSSSHSDGGSSDSHSGSGSDSGGNSWNQNAWQQPTYTAPTTDPNAEALAALAALAEAQAAQQAQEAAQKQQAAKKAQTPRPAATITYGSADDDGAEDVSAIFSKAGDIDRYVSSDTDVALMSGSTLMPRKSGTVRIDGQQRVSPGKYKTVESQYVKVDIPALVDKTTSKKSYDAHDMLDNADGVEIASWKSCRTDVAEIDKDGIITAKGKGTVLIVATSTEGRVFRARITFK